MQLGTRWVVGAEAPSRLPDAVRAAVNAVEAELTDAASRSWTLTWLEGLPIVALDARAGDDDTTVIRYRPDTDSATVSAGDTGEEWAEE